MLSVRILKPAIRELARLDRPIGRRIVERIHWLAENLDSIKPEALTGSLSGLYKLRVGDYRVIYEVIHEEQAIVVHQIGHRREVYRER
jgi:mRNA interferase RelE/StbE